MEIRFADRKVEKECNEQKLLKRKHGERRAKLIVNRLAVLRESKALSDIGPPYRGPYRCHELTGDRHGQLSIDLNRPYRLILTPDHAPPPKRQEGGLDWSKVAAIVIVEIADTHE
jgi:proteic killer suppression protein